MRFHLSAPRTSGPDRYGIGSRFAPWLLVTAFFTACSPVRNPAVESTLSKRGDVRHQPGHFPDVMPDPCEPLNRGLWAVNNGLLRGLIQPSGRVYRTIVPPPARQSINHFTRNITYPGRLVNHALQGRWDGAGQESLRFVCNTTVGAAGLFDVASKWNMPKSEADFGQTFSGWGWKPHGYLMLPLLGPSDDVHAVGLLADEALEPWNYFTPYAYASTGSTYNALTDKVEVASQFIQTEPDAYVGVKYLWTYGSKNQPPDFRTQGPVDIPTLETLAVSRIHTKDPGFIERTREMSVRLPATGRSMKFNCWLQPGPAPLVYVSPGLSMHRISNVTLSQAECLYQNGFSVVTITGVFHPEFMESASTTDLPGHTPVDNHDLLVLLTEIDRKLDRQYPGRFGKKALLGSSWGGFQALELAATEKVSGEGLLHFDRYVAIDIPVDRDYGVSLIDGYHDAPKAWPAADRQVRVNNAIHKATVMAALPAEKLTTPPFDGVETKFLVGLHFRFTLRDAIFCSQMRKNMGILRTPLSKWHRDASYQEILNYSYKDYLSEFVTPYYKQRGISNADLAREGSLRSYGKQLHLLQNVRVIVNQNDFLLRPQDISWLKSTFGSSRLTVFPNGGHLGNLATDAVQKKIIASLDGLK